MGNAYLEAITKENFYIVAEREFSNLEEYILTTKIVLYSLRSSGLR